MIAHGFEYGEGVFAVVDAGADLVDVEQAFAEADKQRHHSHASDAVKNAIESCGAGDRGHASIMTKKPHKTNQKLLKAMKLNLTVTFDAYAPCTLSA